MIISDIINSVVHHEMNDLINLGTIVLIRTVIGYFLGIELKELKES